jgi:hypothetical protein
MGRISNLDTRGEVGGVKRCITPHCDRVETYVHGLYDPQSLPRREELGILGADITKLYTITWRLKISLTDLVSGPVR